MDHKALTFVHPEAKIGENVYISPFVTIEADVEIGDNCWIGANACIMSGTRMGKNCKIYQGSVVGSNPQDLKYQGERTFLEIGDNVIIREFCTINKGTIANDKTIIKNNCLIMAYVHIAHDCIINEGCILANGVNLAGHIEVGKNTVLGGLSAVHQFVKIGEHVMLGGGSLVRKDIPPYVKAAREPLAYAGVNSVGLRRRGFSNQQINNIQDIYRILFVRGYNTSQAMKAINEKISVTPERDTILDFLKNADRGIIKGLRHLTGKSSSNGKKSTNGNSSNGNNSN